MVPMCDVVSIHSPLNNETTRLFDMDMIGRMKRGAYLVNTARSEICDRNAVERALETGKLAGYAADTQLLPDAPARIAGSTLSAQARYAGGTREVLECWFDGVPIRHDYLIIDRGRLIGLGARSYGMKRVASV
jgi:formate dehydrogenase